MKKKRSEIEVLLLTSRDSGRWVIAKGWPMAAKKAHAVAEREAYEEAGAKGKALRSGLKVPVRVQVHALEVQEMLKDFPEKGSRRLEWVSPEEAAMRVKEPELKALFLQMAHGPGSRAEAASNAAA